MKVTLRKKALSGDKTRLYLDFYPPVVHPDTGQPTRREFLKLFLYDKPGNPFEREHNRETKYMAEAVRAQRQLQIQSGNYDFLARDTGNEDFLDFFKEGVQKREVTGRNYQTWKSAYLHLCRYTDGALVMKQLDKNFCESFKDYLLHTHCLNSTKKKLHHNSAAAYFDVFKEAVILAWEDKLLKENPVAKVKSIVQRETEREFLTWEELQAIAKADCSDPVLKRAALFSAFTGLRFGDVRDLKWKEVRYARDHGHFLRFIVNKPSRPETLFIPEQARTILGKEGEPDDQVFIGLTYGNHISKILNEWMENAGIYRHITFHAFRHTFATLQMTYGTDIYTIKDLLAQKNVKTTQIYTRVLDQKKKEAVGRIPWIDLG